MKTEKERPIMCLNCKFIRMETDAFGEDWPICHNENSKECGTYSPGDKYACEFFEEVK